jgi:hypothetical protein
MPPLPAALDTEVACLGGEASAARESGMPSTLNVAKLRELSWQQDEEAVNWGSA